MGRLASFLDQVDSQHTRRAYRTDLQSFFEFQEGGGTERGIAEVSKSEIRSYLRSQQVEGKSLSTLRRRLSALRRFYDWLVEQNLVERNPARECRIDLATIADATGVNAEKPAVLSKAEVERLLQATTEAGEAAPRNLGLILTILYATFRRAELAAMNVEHIRPLGRHWVIDLPAGDAWSSAYVKVPAAVVETIDLVRSRYDINEGALWRSLSNRNRGARMTPDAIYKVIRRTGEAADIDRVNVELLRQTGLHLAMKSGATMRQVQLHARFQSAHSVERYTDDRSRRLDESAPDFIEIDIPSLD